MSSSQSNEVKYSLEGGHILRATLLNGYGNEIQSTLDLDKCIGNEDGK